ncbi:MAG: hypothetical protein WD052_06400 [Bacteroidales bacterium]
MKKLLFVSLIILQHLLSLQAQPERIGAGLTFANKITFNEGNSGNPGMIIKTWISLDKQKDFYLVPSISGYRPQEFNHIKYRTTNYMFHGDLDLQYRLYYDRTVAFAPLAGINFTHIISKNKLLDIPIPDPPADSTISGIGPTLGASLEMRMNSFWDFIVSGRYSFAGIRLGDKEFGEGLIEAPLSALVIQVQAVYYFKSRRRGYSRR